MKPSDWQPLPNETTERWWERLRRQNEPKVTGVARPMFHPERLHRRKKPRLDVCWRCSSKRYKDQKIRKGATRRDCAKCGATWGFPKWS